MEAKPPIRFRKLRIAWLVGCGLLCILLLLLWVRSYWRFDEIYWRVFPQVELFIQSDCGEWTCKFGDYTETSYSLPESHFRSVSHSFAQPVSRSTEYGFFNIGNGWQANLPFWPLTLILVLGTALPWRRFGLRALLIAMALVAVIFGLMAVAK